MALRFVRSPLDEKATGGSNCVGNPTEIAKKLKQRVVFPLPAQLFIDIDGHHMSLEDHLKHIDLVIDTFRVNGLRMSRQQPTPSKTPGHYHLVVTANKQLNTVERIALQAIMGSDLKREMWSYLRASFGEQSPTVFFEAPDDWKPGWAMAEEEASDVNSR
jgi:hypothetical protein